jgi:hypothetical protein
MKELEMRHPPDKRNAPGHHTGGAAISTTESAAETTTHPPHQDTSSQRRDQYELVTIGEFIAPAGRRTLPAAFVRNCPVCGAGNTHRPVELGVTVKRTGSCGHVYLLHVPMPIYGSDFADADSWSDEDGTILRGNQTWMPRVA